MESRLFFGWNVLIEWRLRFCGWALREMPTASRVLGVADVLSLGADEDEESSEASPLRGEVHVVREGA